MVRVLVVEDDPLIREFVVEALQDEGYEVIDAGDGEEALVWCNQRVADVLVTDIKLPGKIDGWQIAEICREHRPDLPVIYATGFSPVDPRPVAGSICLQKPYHPEEIVRAVRQMTERPAPEGRGLMQGIIERNNVHVRGANKRPMMFAHGYGCDQNMWRYVAPAFENDFMTVLFDHVGAGGSDLSAYDRAKYASLGGYADDVVEISRELGLKDAVFVGHSVSAMIGVLAAQKAPGTFAKLVLIGPSARYIDDEGYVGGFSARQIDELLEFLEANHMGWSAQIAPMITGNPERKELAEELTNSFCRTDPEIAKAFARVTFTSDNRKDLSRVTVPTLVLQCSEDIIASPAVGDFVNRNIPDSRMIVLNATGHCPHLSAPEEVVAAMRTFV